MFGVALQSGLAALIAVGGGAAGLWVGKATHRLRPMVSLAAGMLLAVSLVSILPESSRSLDWRQLLAWTGSGYFVFWLVGRFVGPLCPACAHVQFSEVEQKRLHSTALLLLIALAIHSTMDGVALAAGGAVAAEHHGHDTTFLALSVHKLPEGLALTTLLLGAGYPAARALAATALVQLTTILGAVLGATLLVGIPPGVPAAVFAHAGGGFLYLGAHALLGIPSGERWHNFAYGTVGFLAFAALAATFAGH